MGNPVDTDALMQSGEEWLGKAKDFFYDENTKELKVGNIFIGVFAALLGGSLISWIFKSVGRMFGDGGEKSSSEKNASEASHESDSEERDKEEERTVDDNDVSAQLAAAREETAALREQIATLTDTVAALQRPASGAGVGASQ